MSKLKTISDLEKKCLVGSSWYDNEDNITEYQDFFFDELLFDLARPWPLEIKECVYCRGTEDEGERDRNRWAFRGHGGTLLVEDYPNSLNVLKTWDTILTKYKPKSILETGTNSGIFGFLCYKFLGNDFKLTTLDIEPNSKICVDEVNKYFDNNLITFYEMDINTRITNWEVEEEYDFAFIDSGHDEEILTKELNFCDKRKVPIIVCDDWILDAVNDTINVFLENSNYTLIETYNGITDNSIGYLKILKRNG
tara:strand:+ start:3537 stop:4292 length:756 start_codon:yes stop_codon:yes gene_type:complete